MRRSLNDPTFGPFLLDGDEVEIYMHVRTTFTDRAEIGERASSELDRENCRGIAHRHMAVRVKANQAMALGGRHTLVTAREMRSFLAQ